MSDRKNIAELLQDEEKEGWFERNIVSNAPAIVGIFSNIDVFKQTLGAYFNVKNILVWEKNNHGSGDLLGDYAPKYELIIFCSNGSKKLNGGRSSNVIKCAKMPTDNHPTEKPTNLLRHLIEKSTNKGDLVLDTFAGSFSTARACKEIGRDFICFEVEPEYCRNAKNLLNGVSVSLF